MVRTLCSGEQAIEYNARIHFLDGRSGFIVPGDVVRIDACVPGIAATFHSPVVESKLERGETSFVPNGMGDDLVGRNSALNIVRRGLSNVHTGEITGHCLGVITNGVQPGS